MNDEKIHPNRLWNISLLSLGCVFSTEHLQETHVKQLVGGDNLLCQSGIWRRHNLKMLTGSYWGRCLLKWKMRFRTCKQIFTTSIRSNHLYKQIMTINHLGELPTRLGELFWSNWKNQGDYPVWLLHLQTIDEKFWFGHWANCGYLNSMPHGHQKNNPPRVLPEVLSQEIRADPPWFGSPRTIGVKLDLLRSWPEPPKLGGTIPSQERTTPFLTLLLSDPSFYLPKFKVPYSTCSPNLTYTEKNPSDLLSSSRPQRYWNQGT